MKTLTPILLLLAAAATATPVDTLERDITPLSKRSSEIVHLANCVSAVSCCRPDEDYSQILYYPSGVSDQSGTVPDNNNRCTTSGSSFTTWEGSARACTFPTGVTFTSHINAGAQGGALYSYAGSGYNGKNWKCYKDNQRLLFNPYMPEASNVCRSVYYCLPA